MQVENRFKIGSITKTFVATAVLELVRDGTLRLDDTVATGFPGSSPTRTSRSSSSCGTRAASSTTSRTLAPPSRTWPAIWVRLGAAGPDQARGVAPTELPAGHGILVLEHELPGARPDRRARHRPLAPPGAAATDLQAAAPELNTLPHHPALRAAAGPRLPVERQESAGRHRREAVAGVGCRRSGVSAGDVARFSRALPGGRV